MGLSLFVLLFDQDIWMVLSSLGVEAAFIDLSFRVSIGIRLSSAFFTGLSFLHKTRIPVFRINVSLLCRTTPHCAVRPVDGIDSHVTRTPGSTVTVGQSKSERVYEVLFAKSVC